MSFSFFTLLLRQPECLLESEAKTSRFMLRSVECTQHNDSKEEAKEKKTF